MAHIHTLDMSLLCIVAAFACPSPVMAQITAVPLLDGSTIQLTGGASDVVAIDLNGDRRLDLVSASAGAGTVSIRFGNGVGGFAGGADYPMGAGASDIDVVDVNGDGRPDVISADANADTITVRLGDGTGGLLGKTSFPVGTGPRELASGDMNGDGFVDVAVANYYGDTVSVLHGDGAGNFVTAQAWAVGQHPSDVVLCDLDGDLDLDLVSVDQFSHQISVALNSGGVFLAPVTHPAGYGPLTAAAADLNQDGKVDLALAVLSSNSLGVMLGDGAGGFGAITLIGTGSSPFEIEVADLDGDGLLDLAATDAGVSLFSATAHVAFGTGNGAFTAPLGLVVGAGAYGMSTGDVNGDGLVDLLVASYSTGVNVLRQVGVRSFTAAQRASVLVKPLGVAFGDLTGDGRDELVVACAGEDIYDYGGLTVVRNDGTGVLTSTLTTKLGIGTRDVRIAELTGDAHADVASIGIATGITIHPGVGTGALLAATNWPMSGSPTAFEVADLNFDGHADLLTVSKASGLLSVRRATTTGGTGAFLPEQTSPLAGTPAGVAVADVTGDGVPDAVVSLAVPPSIAVYPGNADGSFGLPILATVPGSAGAIAAADINADGVADVAIADSALALVHVFLATGTGGLNTPTSWPTSSIASSIAIADFDGDGYGDLAVPDVGHSSAELLVNDGAMHWTTHEFFAAQLQTFGIAVGNLDGDGHPDLAVTNSQHNARSVTAFRSRSPEQPFLDVGFGLAGIHGVPGLQGAGLLLPATPVQLALSSAAFPAAAALVIGATPAFTAFRGGVMVPVPQLLITFETAPGGHAVFPATWPAGVPAGTPIWTQAWLVDAHGPVGLAASNGLKLTAR